MSLTQDILNKVNTLSDVEFDYSTTSDFGNIVPLNDDCSAIVMDATVVYFEIKNLPILLKTGKRLTARVYKMYYHVLRDICQKSGGCLNFYSPNSFLLIYPKDKHTVSDVVNIAFQIADLLSLKLRETFEKHTHTNFSMGIDNGNILGTKTINGDNFCQTIWFGTAIDKAATIAQKCLRPFFIGISGTVFHHLDDELRTTTKRILGIKKQVDIWERVSYQYDNVKKHLYQTNFHKELEIE